MKQLIVRSKVVAFFFFVIFLFWFVTACIPQSNSNKQNTNANQNTRVTRGTQTQPTNNNNNNNRTQNTRTNRNNSTNNETNLNHDSIHIARLAESAINKKTIKNNSHRPQTETKSFQTRKDLLKDVVDERDRFIDTTYYMIKMEEGITEVLSDVNMAGGVTQQHYENVIRSFINSVSESETSNNYDCTMFRIYANQFNFNDSLRQEALFYYAECCISNDNLQEAITILENLCKEKMNRGIAPKALVRLGQIYCIMDNKRNATKYFNRLKKEFPRSIYNQLADCGKL